MEQSLLAHKRKLREYQRRLYAKHRERIKSRRAELRAALMPEEVKRRDTAQAEKSAKWRASHPGYSTEYQREYRKTPKGREVVLTATRNSRARRKRIVDELKSKPCKDCGNSFPSDVMEFDHREPTEKSFNISTYGRRVGLDILLEEIAKCDLVCANCHRLRTVNRRLHAKIVSTTNTVDTETPSTIFQPACSTAQNVEKP